MLSDTKALFWGDSFRINPLMSSGLTLFMNGGEYVHASAGLKAAPSIVLTLTAPATNYVEMDDNGVISSNTTGFTAGSTALCAVTTGTAEITGISDVHAMGGLVGQLDGAQVANQGNVGVVGSIPVVFRIDLAAGALAETDVVMTHKVRVIDAFLI